MGRLIWDQDTGRFDSCLPDCARGGVVPYQAHNLETRFESDVRHKGLVQGTPDLCKIGS